LRYTQTQNPNTQKIENPNPDLNLWVLLDAYVWIKARTLTSTSESKTRANTYIIMLQSAQHFDLSEDALSRDNSLKNIWHLLERHAHVRRLLLLLLQLLLLLLGHCALRLVLETGEFGAA